MRKISLSFLSVHARLVENRALTLASGLAEFHGERSSGPLDGEKLGTLDGEKLGTLDGEKLGTLDEEKLGTLDEEKLGTLDEEKLGTLDEEKLGTRDGDEDAGHRSFTIPVRSYY